MKRKDNLGGAEAWRIWELACDILMRQGGGSIKRRRIRSFTKDDGEMMQKLDDYEHLREFSKR